MSRSYYPYLDADPQATPLSSFNLKPKVETEILQAFNAIHSLGVLHGDVRPDNILVAEDGDAVWIVDFEFAEIIDRGDDSNQSEISREIRAVQELLDGFKNAQGGSVCQRDSRDYVSLNATRFIAAREQVH
jgi:serine/threonine protein kinase